MISKIELSRMKWYKMQNRRNSCSGLKRKRDGKMKLRGDKEKRS